MRRASRLLWGLAHRAAVQGQQQNHSLGTTAARACATGCSGRSAPPLAPLRWAPEEASVQRQWRQLPLWLRRQLSTAADGGGGSDGSGSSGSGASNGGGAGGAALGQVGAHPRDRNIAMVFTCKKCDTRAAKAFSRHSYENGIVIVRCPGCQSMHLVADNLGWFEHGEKGFRIEDLLRARGERVVRISEHGGSGGGGGEEGEGGAAALSPEDVAGWSKVQELIHASSGQGGGAGSSSGGGGGSSSGGGGGGDGSSGGLLPGGDGVLSVSPADLDAWARVSAAGERPEGGAAGSGGAGAGGGAPGRKG